MSEPFPKTDMGMYIHIPYCSYLCHYCDFAKTANWDEANVDVYFKTLESQVQSWLSYLSLNKNRKLSSLFFGGGTPGLFTDRLEPIVDLVKPFLIEDAEISLEANPNNVNEESVKSWVNSGFNRISIGIQTFQPEGLKFLKRDHNIEDAINSVKIATSVFPSVNLDLIYGWIGQDLNLWEKDLETALALGTNHLSLYNLIFESRTPLGRSVNRKKISPQDEELQVSYFEKACELLQENNFGHDEVSNWAQNGHSCRHNWLYWTAKPYLAVGSGAHGFIEEDSNVVGLRYSYPKNDRLLKNILSFSGQKDMSSVLANAGLGVENRDAESWLTEYIGCGLRCRAGIDLQMIKEKSGFELKLDSSWNHYLDQGLLTIESDRLFLDPKEWIRETTWSLKILEAMQKP